MNYLKSFMQSQGTPLHDGMVPAIDGHVVDLARLFQAVIYNGGSQRVISTGFGSGSHWKNVLEGLGIAKDLNVGTAEQTYSESKIMKIYQVSPLPFEL